MILVPQTAFSFQSFQMRRTESPITLRLSWNHVEMEVRYFLTAAGAVVLIQQNSVWGVGIDQCPRNPFGGSHHSRFFGFFQVK